MTRKHFVAIADALAEGLVNIRENRVRDPQTAAEEMIAQVEYAISQFNYNFDAARFRNHINKQAGRI